MNLEGFKINFSLVSLTDVVTLKYCIFKKYFSV